MAGSPEHDGITTLPPPSHGPGTALGLERPGRALLGWMTPEDAKLVQAGRQVDRQDDPELEQRAARARSAVSKRTPGIDQQRVLDALPPVYDPYLAELRNTEAGGAMFAEGWDIG